MGKYKFSLNPKIKGYIEWQLEHYLEDKKALEEYKRDLIASPVQGYSQTGGIRTGDISNPTERDGIKLATNPYILSVERTIKAIESALDQCDQTDKKLVDLVYWRRSHTIIGAGEQVGLKQNGAYKRINKNLVKIALEMGLINL